MRQTGEVFDLGVTVGGAGLAGNVPATVSTAGLRAPVREMPEKDVRFVHVRNNQRSGFQTTSGARAPIAIEILHRPVEAFLRHWEQLVCAISTRFLKKTGNAKDPDSRLSAA
ncbi:hypothetical protein EHI42_01840 [Rhizobium hidalgonense]|uniref:hypothetical protein n=1 Tax=Rhizobium hidalgonense TaxID=1538159 RepID=UPI000FEC3089|nr:hypothetical protein [Rhizobium hidalgonense]RWX20172.1 hypothetical protein EHI42_01840 [Rhizobium hidalgonense]